MAMPTDLLTYLRAQSAITNIVGSTGVYWTQAPETKAPPYVTFKEISRDRAESRDFTGAAGIAYAVYQIDCIDTTKDGTGSVVVALAAAVDAALDAYAGAMGSTTVHLAKVINRFDNPGAPEHGKGRIVDHIALEVEICFNE